MNLADAIRSRNVTSVRASLATEGDHATTIRDERGWTPLMVAAEQGHTGIARLILEATLRAVRVDDLRSLAVGPDGTEALTLAAARDHRPTFDALAAWLPDNGFIRKYPTEFYSFDSMEESRQINAEYRRRARHDYGDGATIKRLVAACAAGDRDAVAWCLAQGVPAHGCNSRGDQGMEQAVKYGRAEIVRLLIAAGADPDARSNWSTTLMDAARAGFPEVIHALIEGGAEINGKQALLETALMRAVDHGQHEAARTLIELGIDLNARDDDNRSALSRALGRNDGAMVELLKQAGAREHQPGLEAELISAAEAGDLARVHELIAAGVWLATPRSSLTGNSDERQTTPLNQAIAGHHVAVVQALLQAGVLAAESIRTIGRFLVMAAEVESPAIVRLLLEAGVNVNSIFTGPTALAAAAGRGNLEIVTMLLAAGANPNKGFVAPPALNHARIGAKSSPDRASDYAAVIATLSAHGAVPTWQETPYADLRGTGPEYDDYGAAILLVRRSVAETVPAWAAARGTTPTLWEQDVARGLVELGPLDFLVGRLRGQTWTVIRSVRNDHPGEIFEVDALVLSERLAGEALFYRIDTRTQVVTYALYDAGQRVERFYSNQPPEWDFGDEIAIGTGRVFDRNNPRPCVEFESTRRTIPPGESVWPIYFADEFLRSQDAFGFVDPIHLEPTNPVNPTHRLQFALFDVTDFDRIDIIHLPAKALPDRTLLPPERPEQCVSPPEEDEDEADDQDWDEQNIPF